MINDMALEQFQPIRRRQKEMKLFAVLVLVFFIVIPVLFFMIFMSAPLIMGRAAICVIE